MVKYVPHPVWVQYGSAFTPLDIENAHFKSVKSTVRSFTLRSSNFNHCEMVKDLMSSNVSCDMCALVAHT